MEVRVFSYETGWDFDDPLHRSQLLELLQQEMPDELFLAPVCKLWSMMQNINARDDAQRERLQLEREYHHRTHLRFVRRAYLVQVHGGRHAHLEQPEGALSWRTGALCTLPGHWACFDQCRYGVMCLDEDGIWKPVKKSTAILTTKMAVQAALHLRCDHQHEHCRLEGSAVGYGSRTKYVEDYQPSLAATIAAALMVKEKAQHWEMAMAVPDHQDVSGKIAALHTSIYAEALRTVQRLHRNLGHPSAEALTDLLTARGASDEVLNAARQYQCAACLRYKKPNQVAPASVKQVKEFGEQVQADVFWIRVGSKKYPILSVIDQATKFQAAALLHGERGVDLVTALERAWIRHFGVPQKLITDEGRGWVGGEMEEWTNFNSVEHEVAPGEAHNRLALVERRHSVLRKAVELYLEEMKLSDEQGVRKALTYVLPQVNAAPSVAGYSPTQWLLGKQIRLPGELSQDSLNPAHLGGHPNFEELLKHRNAAKRALLDAETDSKLRRALLRKYQGSNIPLKNGQKCYFWRDARQGELVKIRWHGPARVVMVEHDQENVPKVYWLAYKTQLIRCAPHHVRSDFNSMEHAIEDIQLAKKEVMDLKSRGVTRILDLNMLNRNNVDDILEEDEEMAGEEEELEVQEDGDERPLQRRRLSLEQEHEYSPSIAPTSPGDRPDEVENQPHDPPLLPVGTQEDGISVDLTEILGSSPRRRDPTATEPSGEPSAPPTMPATPAGNATPTLQNLGLDPQFTNLYEIAGPESFHERRRRVDRQETFGFGPAIAPRQHAGRPYSPRPALPPQRLDNNRPIPPSSSTATAATPEPSPVQPQPSSEPQPAADIPVLDEEALYSQAFELQGISENDVPTGWRLDGSGYFQLDNKMQDYWEVRAGCVIRHHLVPRRKFFRICTTRDCPLQSDQLDLLRTTVVKTSDGNCGIHTDPDIVDYELDYLWTGITVYQIKGPVRKEMAMTTHSRPLTIAKQQVRYEKKKVEKNKSNLSERTMTLHERELFMQAKVKELKSFFEHGVWEFSTAEEADTSRTLSSRLLLKWSKNSDGTPRAKARLIVRGYADRDALEGRIDTAAPTTSRLSRSMLLSVMATMRWSCWTADVSTAFLQGLPQERQLWVKLPAEALKILGASPDTRMLLKKPCYGQLDAPRRWFLEAVRRLKALGFRQHILDPCLFLLFENDFAEAGNSKKGTFGDHRLCGMICLHVDDMLGCGNVDSPVYSKIEKQLQESFNFREWQTSSKLEYCGATLEKDAETGTWKMHHAEYLHKVKPISLDRSRSPEDYMTAGEITKFRGLLGSLQWPAVQSQPHLQCSASLLAGQMSAGLVKSITDANKLLKFAKENSDVSLRYSYLDEPQNLRLACMFDAAFCVRRDNASQGGYIVMLVPESTFHGKESEYHVIDWKSSKLPRVARSSLGAEAQAAGQAADSVDFICKFWDHLWYPNLTLEQLLHRPCGLQPTIITDAKALYDSYFREGATGSITDKRVGLEIQVTKERMQKLGGTMKWISSERQFADSLTKEQTRQLLADRLRYHKVKFTWDPEYQAAKKKNVQDRNRSRDEFTQARKAKPVPEEEEESGNKPAEPVENIEISSGDDGEAMIAFTTKVLEYVDISKYDTVISNNLTLSNDDVPQYAETLMYDKVLKYDLDTVRHGEALLVADVKVPEYVMNILRALLLLAMALYFLGAMSLDATEMNQCPATRPEEEARGDQALGWFEGALLTALMMVGLIGYMLGRQHGWYYGREQRLQVRHIGYERVTNRCEELEAQNEKLKESIAEYRAASYNLGRGLSSLRDENYDIAEYVMYLETRLEEKDRELQALRAEQTVQLAVTCGVMQRARSELVAHSQVCPMRKSIWICRSGRVWHAEEGCRSMQHAIPVEWSPCSFCASRTSTPYLNDLQGRNLLDDLSDWMQTYGQDDLSAGGP